MTDQRTRPAPRDEAERCIVGRSLESPCPFPATEPVSHWGDGVLQLCAYHAATEPLVEEHSDLHMALDELLPEWQKRADELANRPLHDVLWRAQEELEQRLALIEGVVEDLAAAERRLFRR